MATKKIAILWSEPIADDNFYQNVTRYITEWTEVSEEAEKKQYEKLRHKYG